MLNLARAALADQPFVITTKKCPLEFTQKMSTKIHLKRQILVDKNDMEPALFHLFGMSISMQIQQHFGSVVEIILSCLEMMGVAHLEIMLHTDYT